MSEGPIPRNCFVASSLFYGSNLWCISSVFEGDLCAPIQLAVTLTMQATRWKIRDSPSKAQQSNMHACKARTGTFLGSPRNESGMRRQDKGVFRKNFSDRLANDFRVESRKSSQVQ